jgi:hypothetical protein
MGMRQLFFSVAAVHLSLVLFLSLFIPSHQRSPLLPLKTVSIDLKPQVTPPPKNSSAPCTLCTSCTSCTLCACQKTGKKNANTREKNKGSSSNKAAKERYQADQEKK